MSEIRGLRLGRAEEEAGARRAADGVLRAAAAGGLVDVGYAEVDSPFGPLLVATTRRDWSGWPIRTRPPTTSSRSWPTRCPHGCWSHGT